MIAGSNYCRVSFIEGTLLRIPEKAFNRVSTISFLSKLRKQILQLIVDYDVL